MSAASVSVAGDVIGSIGPGLCVLVGVTHGDDSSTAERMAHKIWHLRVFQDDAGRMNLSACDSGKQVLVVSQFTLYADTTRGRRPSFVEAAATGVAEPVVDQLVVAFRSLGAEVATGRFGASMAVSLTNDGPVTVIVEA